MVVKRTQLKVQDSSAVCAQTLITAKHAKKVSLTHTHSSRFALPTKLLDSYSLLSMMTKRKKNNQKTKRRTQETSSRVSHHLVVSIEDIMDKATEIDMVMVVDSVDALE